MTSCLIFCTPSIFRRETKTILTKLPPHESVLIPINIADSNTDDSFTMAKFEPVFVSLGNFLDSPRKQIFMNNRGKFSYFFHEMYVVCTH